MKTRESIRTLDIRRVLALLVGGPRGPRKHQENFNEY
jgi:hypothetical protein